MLSKLFLLFLFKGATYFSKVNFFYWIYFFLFSKVCAKFVFQQLLLILEIFVLSLLKAVLRSKPNFWYIHKVIFAHKCIKLTGSFIQISWNQCFSFSYESNKSFRKCFHSWHLELIFRWNCVCECVKDSRCWAREINK